MMGLWFRDELNFSDLRSEVKQYSMRTFRADLNSALIVALIAVPQAVAYALVAGLPPSCGLFAAILTTIVAGLFGSSRHLVIGPNNALAILVSFGMAEVISRHFPWLDAASAQGLSIQILTQLTLMIGIFQLLASVFKLGRLTQFVSYSVVTGYIAGAAVAVMVSQLYTMTGISRNSGDQSTYHQLHYLFQHLPATHLPSLFVGIGSLAFLICFRRTRLKNGAALIMIGASGLAVYLGGNRIPESLTMIQSSFPAIKELGKVPIVNDVGDVGLGALRFQAPYFNMSIINTLIPTAFALALLGMLEVTSIAKSIAAKSGQRLSTNQEILALGIGNTFGSFVGAMPSSSSLSRSALNYDSGGKTRFAAVLNGCVVGGILYFFGGFVTLIPLPALAALLLYIAFNMVNRELLAICLRATSADAFVLITTFLSCFFLSLDLAFYFGVCLSVTLYLKKASTPNLNQYTVPTKDFYHRESDGREIEEIKKVRIVEVEGELFFGAADLFQTTLKTIAEDDKDTRVIVLNLSTARDLDATACLAIKRLDDYLIESGRYLLLCGVKQPCWDVLCHSGLVETLGKDRIFVYYDIYPHLSLSRAMKKAAKILGVDEKDFAYKQNNQLMQGLFMQSIK